MGEGVRAAVAEGGPDRSLRATRMPTSPGGYVLRAFSCPEVRASTCGFPPADVVDGRLAAAILVLVVRRWLRATGPARRRLAPVMFAGLMAALLFSTGATALGYFTGFITRGPMLARRILEALASQRRVAP